jgi:hypothetical protein
MAAEPILYASAKVFSGIGGLMGGFSLLAFVKPKGVVDAVLHGGVSTGCAIIFAGPVIRYFNALPDDWEFQMMAGFLIGFCAWFLMSAIANFFIKNEGKDILEVAAETKTRVKKVRKA